MSAAAHLQTRRRLALLFSLPLAFSVLFFSVDLATEHTGIDLLRIQNLSSGIDELRSLAYDVQAGERGFLLFGDEHYRLPFEQANSSLPSQIDSCERYAKDEAPALRTQVDSIVGLVKKRFEQANQVMNTQRAQGFAPALDVAKSNGSEETMNAIRLKIGVLQNQLDREKSDYLDSQRRLNHWRFIFFAAGTLVLIGVMIWLYNDMVAYLQARDEAHAKLEKLNAELEGRIEERTRDLTQANEELQQFAYVASHDLQEPLRTITSFTQLLATRYQGRLDEDADEFIGYIVTSSRRMTDLINGLLALVRLRKAGQAVVPISFERLLEEAEITLQAAIRESQAEIQHGPLPALAVDKVQFSQVLQNLISNAIKYRREEPPLIRVEAQRDGSNWIFSVSDNGRGFNQQFAERIFGIFQRLHSRDVEGTGMGLSISRKILERHGGRIWAQSREGAGSTFYFSLPVSLEVSRQPRGEQPAKAAVQA
jgi:signal transduction histidine kinase